jgi:3-isopropylmalate/(R)-2-methylmalate dehydratase small subunit
MAIERITLISGRALPLRGDNIDTDRIIPARFLRSVSFEGLEDHLFEDDVSQAAGAGVAHAIADARFAGATVLVVNRNFGCGSSREHAPQAIFRRGFRAVIGQSFSEIFFGNSVALGMPCVSATAGDVDALLRVVEHDPSLRLVIDVDRLELTAGHRSWPLTLPAAAREAFLDGSWDATALLLDNDGEIEAVANRLPYVTGW